MGHWSRRALVRPWSVLLWPLGWVMETHYCTVSAPAPYQNSKGSKVLLLHKDNYTYKEAWPYNSCTHQLTMASIEQRIQYKQLLHIIKALQGTSFLPWFTRTHRSLHTNEILTLGKFNVSLPTTCKDQCLENKGRRLQMT